MAQHRIIDPGDIKGAIKKRFHGAGNGRKVYRRAQEDTVGILHQLNVIVNVVCFDNAALIAVLDAGTASCAAANHLFSEVNEVDSDSRPLKFGRNQFQRGCSIAILFGTTVKGYNVH